MIFQVMPITPDEPGWFVKVFPLLIMGLILFFLSIAIWKRKEKESVVGFSSIVILAVSFVLYYMIVYLDYEILGTYSLRRIQKYQKQLLEAKASLDSLDRHIERLKIEAEAAQRKYEVPLEKMTLYTSEAARTELEMKGHLSKQKEIENTIANFDKSLSKTTQDLIKFSFLIANQPLLLGGGTTQEFEDELVRITQSLGHQLKFDPDSLIKQTRKDIEELRKQTHK